LGGRVLPYHATILPVVLRMLDDASAIVTEVGCLVVDWFCEQLEPHVMSLYLDPIMTKMGELLGRTGAEVTVGMHENAVCAIAAVAISAEAGFRPYLPGTAAALLQLMALTDPLQLRLRSKATQCFGFMCVACGRDAVQSYVPAALQLVQQGMGIDFLELREDTFVFFGCMAEVLREECGPFLKDLVAMVSAACASSDGVTLDEADGIGEAGGMEHLARLAGKDVDEDEAGAAAGGGGDGTMGRDGDDSNDEGDDEEEEDEEDEDDGDVAVSNNDMVNIRVKTSFMDVKVAAVTTLGRLAGYCGAAYAPYLEKTTHVLRIMCDHWHEEIKCSAVRALQMLMRGYLAVYPADQTGQEQVGGATIAAVALQPAVAELYAHLLDQVVTKLTEEPEKEVVANAVATLNDWVKVMGATALQVGLPRLMTGLTALLNHNALCQTTDDDGGFGGEEEEDGGDGQGHGHSHGGHGHSHGHSHGGHGHSHGHGSGGCCGGDGGDGDEYEDTAYDRQLMEEVAGLLATMAGALGHQFAALLPTVMPPMLKFAQPSRSGDDRAMALGFFADAVGVLGPLFGQYVPAVAPLTAHGLLHGNLDVKRNGAFCASALISHATDACRPYVGSLLTAVQPLFSLTRGKESDDAAIDNALSTLARAVTAVPEMLPLDAAVSGMLSLLPLRADQMEGTSVYGCLMRLLAARSPALMPHLGRLVAVAGTVLGPGSLSPEDVQRDVVAAGLRAFLASANAEERAALTAAVGAVADPGQQAALLAACS
jgi:hypothetical protein